MGIRTENAASTNQSKIDRNNTTITRLEAENTELEQVRTEINALINSADQSYTVIIDSSLKTTGITGTSMTGEAHFNNNTGDFEIRIPSDCSLGLFAHELLHAYQFHIGENSNGPIIYMHYDLHDEWDAYERGELFGDRNPYKNIDQIGNDPIYKDVPKTRNSSSLDLVINQIISSQLSQLEKEKKLKQIARQRKMTFRVNGKTYTP